MSVPDIEAELDWQGELRFAARAGAAPGIVLDSAGQAGPSPAQALGLSLAGCMAMDVVHILGKGRVPLASLRLRLTARRAQDHPRRILGVNLHFLATGDVPAEKLERAIALSRKTYCSVWHSLRPEIDFQTSFEVAR